MSQLDKASNQPAASVIGSYAMKRRLTGMQIARLKRISNQIRGEDGARKYLVDHGFINEQGDLTPEYGGPCAIQD